ncbi:hypothetical protein SO3561_02965 [Streptomyces olivochromogenes]|uniref:Uncharacterized protein n=1 Tax=Streptomyces olivochromogenes TaxID=1963 RepID=A0A250VB93_STROL|nr:hypothetical protein SO3561_02965 [Streptomyces olivochromogenes]
MKVARRVGLFAVPPLMLVLAAGYGWYQWSDTGNRRRYEDKLASYGDALVPYAESARIPKVSTQAEHTLPEHSVAQKTGSAQSKSSFLMKALLPSTAIPWCSASGSS